jgi:glycosyltransferase involved in cell wall biosynthesis
MGKLISVIVPVYNVREYLNQSVDSIINQSYKNLEIILVDDGSTDSSGELCDEYAKRDSRIKIIHKENGGLSDARNAGVDIATGYYVGFVDSDDIIDRDMYAILDENIEKENADVSICNWRGFTESDIENVKNTRTGEKIVLSGIESLEFLIYGKDNYNISFSVWDRLYKKELIDEFRFPKGKCYEDIVWSAKVMYKSEKSVYIDRELYYYRRREDSIIGADRKNVVSERVATDEIPEMEAQIEFLENIGREDMADESRYYLYQLIIIYYMRCHYSNNSLQKHFLNLIKKYRQWAKVYMHKSISLYRKCSLFMSLYLFKILVVILHIKKSRE